MPVSKWAVGISGAIAAFSLVLARFDGVAGTFAAGIAILILMILMVLFAAMAGMGKSSLRPIALVLAWSFMLLFVGASTATVTSLFLDEPKPFQQLVNEVLSALGSDEATAELSLADDAEAQRQAAEAVANENLAKQQEELLAAEQQLAAQTPANQQPPKIRVPIAGGLYKTISYWSGGKNQRTTWCQAELVPVEGMSIIGAADTVSYDGRKLFVKLIPNARGCAPAKHCDSHNDFCKTYYRKAGCYISTDWLEWYRASRKEDNLPEREDDICQA